ncbi:hypothetical protein WR25_00106 [Diploscapter pachys]|uniref:Galactose mutarotase n=1 Tax=Diploscapter pachys TaxID=2018661 RepID=A0A2A2K6H9_9BILA|nr:hypothetical protein WR25_00106 [Diploscapter pachys]
MFKGEQPPAHGLVRGRDWQLLRAEEHGDHLQVEFELPEAQGDLPGWPHEVQLKLLVELGDQLKLTLTSYNLGNTDVTLSQALHSYFAVSDVRRVQVEGVDGLAYIETLANWEQRKQQGNLGFAGETDRIYLNAPDRLAIRSALKSLSRGGPTCPAIRSARLRGPHPPPPSPAPPPVHRPHPPSHC